MQEAEGQARQEPEVMLNYNQYYPTMLPLRQPGMEETDAEAHARDDRPPDLSLHQVPAALQFCTQFVEQLLCVRDAVHMEPNWIQQRSCVKTPF